MSKMFYASPDISSITVTETGKEPTVLYRSNGSWLDLDGRGYLPDLVEGAYYTVTYPDTSMWLQVRLLDGKLTAKAVQWDSEGLWTARTWTGEPTTAVLDGLLAADDPWLPIWEQRPHVCRKLAVAALVEFPSSLESAAEAPSNGLFHDEVEVSQVAYLTKEDHEEEVTLLRARVIELEEQVSDSVPF